MSFKIDSATARTIGIDTGKNTLHMIGLDRSRLWHIQFLCRESRSSAIG
jgi:hypothetical protein